MLPYASAIVPPACWILGAYMRPFSLGHAMLLRHVDSPFLGNKKPEQPDVVLGAWLCALGWDAASEIIARDEMPRQLAAWKKKAFRRCGLWRKKIDYSEAIERFAEYVADGFRQPDVWQYESRGGPSYSAPWEQLIKVRLIKAGFALDYIMNTYLPLVYYDYYTVVESDQAANLRDAGQWRNVFVTERERETMNAVRRTGMNHQPSTN